MLENSILRQRARYNLKNNIFSPKWLLTSIVFLLSYVFSYGISMIFSFIIAPVYMVFLAGNIIGGISIFNIILSALISYFAMMLIAYGVAAAAEIFLLGPLQVGIYRYLLANRDPYDNETPSFSLLFSAFNKDQYKYIMKASAWKALHLYLWLLIPIGGWVVFIIKSIQYMFTEPLLADNPQQDYRQVLEKSSRMTYGKKADLFVLALFFIGWLIVGVLCLGIGIFFAQAYMYQSFAEAYDDRKKFCVSNGTITPADIGFNLNGEPNDPFWQPLNLNNYYIRNRNYSRMANSRANYRG